MGSVGYAFERDAMVLSYSIGSADDLQHVQVRIDIDRVPCRYGGNRRYWTCPRCGARIEVTIMAGRGWGCRRCLHLRYVSQGLSPESRMQRRANSIYERLGAPDGGFVRKPKWMRWRTFNSLFGQAKRLDLRSDTLFLARLCRLGFQGIDEAIENIISSS
jgi:hypothetical protein